MSEPRGAAPKQQPLSRGEAFLRPYIRLFPHLKLHPPPHDLPTFDPDPRICLSYYDQFWKAAKEGSGDKVLKEFLKEHPVEFECSGWVVEAVGWVVLGYPDRCNGRKRSEEFLRLYWTDFFSPRPHNWLVNGARVYRALEDLTSEHATCWTRVAKYLITNGATKGWSGRMKRYKSKVCHCLTEQRLAAIEGGYVKLVNPNPAAVVLESLAVFHDVSSRYIAQERSLRAKGKSNAEIIYKEIHHLY